MKSCCCGCTLRTGTLVLAWLSLIGGVLGIIVGIFGVVKWKHVNVAKEELFEEEGEEYDEDEKDFLHIAISYLTAFFIFLIVVGCIKITVSIILIFGVNQERPSLFLPWIIYSTSMLVLESLGLLMNIIFASVSGKTDKETKHLYFAPCDIAIGIYFLMVVKSYRNQLKANNLALNVNESRQLKCMNGNEYNSGLHA